MGSAASRDLNGDGAIKPENDQLGYVAKHAANRALMTSMDTSIIHRGVDNVLTADGISERLVNVYEKLKPFLSDPTLTQVTTEPDMIALSQPFIEGRVLFLTNCMIGVEGMRDMADDYGIIPLPKYDETQENYYSQSHFHLGPVHPCNGGKRRDARHGHGGSGLLQLPGCRAGLL